MTTEKVTKENVVQAYERLRPYVRQTPVFDYQTGRLDSAVNFKFEHLQARARSRYAVLSTTC